MLGNLGQDLRVAVRGLVRAPLLSLAALATLALAIGGSTAVYALVDAVLLRSLPYADAGRLVAVWIDMRGRAAEMGLQDPRREWSNADAWTDLRTRSTSLEDVAAFTGWTPTLGGEGEAQRLQGASPTWNGLEVLGVQPVLGRGFTAADGEPGAQAVVVLGHALWQREFGGARDVLGRTISLNRTPYTVVGVLPPGFQFPFQPEAEVFTPLQLEGGDRGSAYLRQFGRLAPGVDVAQSQLELDLLASALQREYPAEHRGTGLFVEPLQSALSTAVRPQLLVLQGAALMVLLIAVANLASVMVARSQGRRGEFAVRAVLGAGRGRQLRLLLVEAGLLALVGAALGLVLAGSGMGLLVAMFPEGFGTVWNVRLDLRAALLALLVALGVALAIAAAAHASLRRIALVEATTQAGGRMAGSRGGGRLGAALVAFNVALALSVTVASLLLVDSHGRLQQVDLGYRPDGLLSGSVMLPASAYPDAAALTAAFPRLREALLAQPGVESIGLSSSLPLGLMNNDTSVAIEGAPTARPDGRAHVWINRVSHDFLPTLDVALVEGRMFSASDGGEGARRALVNRAFVREYLQGTSPLGRRINFGSDGEPNWFDIVGVVDDVRFFDVSAAQTPSVYGPLPVLPARGIYVTARTGGDALALAPALRAAVQQFDPGLALSDLRSMEQRVDADLALPRAVSRASLLFALCGLLLAGVGVYGTLAHSVLRRTRELGVRRALGANDARVLHLVAGHALRPILLGLLLGAPLAWAMARALQGVLYEVGLFSPQAWLGALGLLAVVAVLAAALPWRSAVRVPPMVALRHE